MKILIFTFFICKIISYIYCKNNLKNILLLGHIRSGKSLFINSLFNKNVSKVGIDDGEPTTKNINSYITENLNLIDTPGMNNNLDDLILLYTLINHIILNKIDVDYVLLTHSLNQELDTLKYSLDKIKFFFGDFDHFTLVITKSVTNQVIEEKKINYTLKTLQNYNINNPYLKFNCKSCNGDLIEALPLKEFEVLKVNLNNDNFYSYEKLKYKIRNINNTIIKKLANNTILDYDLIKEGLKILYKEFKNEISLTDEKIENEAYDSFVNKSIIAIIITSITSFLVWIRKTYLISNKNTDSNSNEVYNSTKEIPTTTSNEVCNSTKEIPTTTIQT